MTRAGGGRTLAALVLQTRSAGQDGGAVGGLCAERAQLEVKDQQQQAYLDCRNTGCGGADGNVVVFEVDRTTHNEIMQVAVPKIDPTWVKD